MMTLVDKDKPSMLSDLGSTMPNMPNFWAYFYA